MIGLVVSSQDDTIFDIVSHVGPKVDASGLVRNQKGQGGNGSWPGQISLKKV